MFAELDPQIKARVGHCVCMAETGLAAQHWLGKSEGCAWPSQRSIGGLGTYPP